MSAALLPALLAVILWGLSFVATKVALQALTPMAVVFGRTLLAALFLLGVLRLRRQSLRPPAGLWPRLLLAGFLGVFLHQGLQAYGLTLTTAVRTGWLIGVIPIWSALLALVWLGERLHGRRAAGLAVGLAGVILLLTDGRLAGFELVPHTKGDLLILASTVNWAVYTVLGRSLLARAGALQTTTIAMLAGLVLLLPVTPWADLPRQIGGASPVALSAVVFLGIGCSGLAYLCWYASLRRVPASAVAALLYLEPLVTLAGGVVLLGEGVAGATLAGGVLVLAGVWLVSGTGGSGVRRFLSAE